MKTKIDNSSSYHFHTDNKTLDFFLNDKYFSSFRVIDDSLFQFTKIPNINLKNIYIFKKSFNLFLIDIKNNNKLYPVHFNITFKDNEFKLNN